MTTAIARTGITDVAGWVGTYPFRGIRGSSLEDLGARCGDLGIDRIVVSAFENLFWQNNLDAYASWAQRVFEHPILSGLAEYWPVINPAHPGQLRRLEPLLDRFEPRGIRLLPNYHRYHTWDPRVADLMALARERNLVVQVFCRIADERWHWMLRTAAVDLANDLMYLASQFDEQRILLSALNPGELGDLAPRVRQLPGLYVDISRMRGPAFALEGLLETLSADKILFGSLWPLQMIEATLWQVTWSRAPEATKQAILQGNFQRMIPHEHDVQGRDGTVPRPGQPGPPASR